MRTPFLKATLGVASFSVVSFLAPSAGAVEHEHTLGVGLGVSTLNISDKSTSDVGAGLGLFYSYGLTDQFNLLIEGGSSLVALGTEDPKSPPTRPHTITYAAAGVSYVLDVLQWVPYGGLLIGGAVLGDGTVGTEVLPDAQLALGLDYKLSHKLSVGVAGRFHVFFTQTDVYPVAPAPFINVFARMQYSWGW